MIAFLFDTETTGLVKNSLVPAKDQPRVIEFFGHAVNLASGEALGEVEFFCDPGVPLDPIITRITGITPDQIRGQPAFHLHAQTIADMMKISDAAIAHNLSFDMQLLDSEFERAGLGPVPWPDRLICTVEATEWIKGYRLKLNDMHTELFGEPFAGAHRARTDVEAMTRCAIELFKRGDL